MVASKVWNNVLFETLNRNVFQILNAAHVTIYKIFLIFTSHITSVGGNYYYICYVINLDHEHG